ncbi:MAG: alkaline phosphatase [Kiritimatiellae bacterium]|nr:alkaline phosphatase [Kiritimatiellia bacterium]
MKKLVFALAVAALCGCVCEQGGEAKKKPVAKHVVLIGVDGFGARWIPWDRMPNLSNLRENGLYAVGRDNFPTSSAINWATVFYGTVVEVHGFREWNSRKPDPAPPAAALDGDRLPCIFSEIRRQDPSAYTASLYTWDGVGFCHNTNTLSFVKYFGGEGGDAYPSRDAGVVEEGVKELAKKPKMILFYNGQPDSFGHKYGWGTPEYTNACERVDEGIGRIVEGIKKAGMWDDTVIMLVADHGGEGKKHGMANLNCFEIPFLVSGPAVKGMRLREPVLLADTAPTIAELLGYQVPECWRGRPAVVKR